MRICPVTGSKKWHTFYSSECERIMTGDQRIIKGKLDKIICPDSGVVANKSIFTQEELELFYGYEYELNTLGKEEHFFYNTNGAISRSEVFFDWISPHLPKDFNSLVEIGCGEGNLLRRFAFKFPKTAILGLDGSHKASQFARNKGLNARQFLVGGEEAIPKAEVFLLVNVIEHIENIPQLISILIESLCNAGRIIFCLPIQDYGGYDIFFAEHVWHFTAAQFEAVLKRNGLKIIYSDINHPINHGIGLFVCEKDNQEISQLNFIYSDAVMRNLNYWEDKFKKLDNFILSNNFKKVAIFGAGEVSTLFLTFTLLGNCNVIACIDETKKSGEQKNGIPIVGFSWLNENMVDCLMLTLNKKYYDNVLLKLKMFKLNIHEIY